MVMRVRPAGQGWYQIVGSGQRGGVNHGFLLTPIPEPETWMLLLLGLAAIGLRRRSKSELRLMD
jgi:hypothetical protein